MAKGPTSPFSCIEEFINEEYRNSKPYTKQKCRWALQAAVGGLMTNGYEASPYRIREPEVDFLLNEYWKELLPSTKKGYLCYLNKFLAHYNNKTVKRMNIVLSQDMRVHVDWLDHAQEAALLDEPMNTLERTVIHLELCMGLRSVEVCRLRCQDIRYGRSPHLQVRGKGRGDGKYRSVPFHADTASILEEWSKHREKIVRTVRSYNPYWEDPGNLLIWSHYRNKPQAGPYSEMGGSLDQSVIIPLRNRVGFHFGNHTLRRTFGRNLYHAEVDLETIAKILGHESTSETLRYIGINLDDMNEAMNKLAKYQQNRVPRGKQDAVVQTR